MPRGCVVREGVPTAADKGSAKEELPLRQELKHGGQNLRRHLHHSTPGVLIEIKKRQNKYVSSYL